MTNMQFLVVAPHPDGRHKGMFKIACKSTREAQLRIEQHHLDVEQAVVLHGVLLPVSKKTVVQVGDEPRRRGRPLGSKNKVKRADKVAAAAETVGELVNGKTKRKAKKTATKRRAAKRKGGAAGHAKETQAERNARVEASA